MYFNNEIGLSTEQHSNLGWQILPTLQPRDGAWINAKIRFRAERRLGEMMAAQPKAKGGKPYKTTGLKQNPVDRKATLAEAGIAGIKRNIHRIVMAFPPIRHDTERHTAARYGTRKSLMLHVKHLHAALLHIHSTSIVLREQQFSDGGRTMTYNAATTDEQKKDERLHVLVPSGLKAQLFEAAHKRRVSVGELVRLGITKQMSAMAEELR